MIQRIKSFCRNVCWLSQITKGKLSAACFIVRSKINSDVLGHGSYRDFSVSFRKQDMSALGEVFLDEEYSFLNDLCQKEQLNVLDVGAHIGTFSLWLLSVNQHANILSVEADPETYKVLEANRTPLEQQDLQWKSINRAAWIDDSDISFSNTGDSMSHKVMDSGEITVQGISFENILNQSGFERVDIMKVDIEGAEEKFLLKQPEILQRIDNLVIEIHPNLCDETKIRQLLNEQFSNIKDIGGRKSSKPLLLCSRA